MAVFRVEKNENYTVMSNHHLRNARLSLKAKGLLSQMLSLPPDWDYTLSGLARINKEGIDAIREAVKELEAEGYITRKRCRNENGRFGANEYVIREEPSLERPTLEKPILEKPMLERPMQLIKEEVNKDKINTDRNKNRIQSMEDKLLTSELQKAEQMRRERDCYREMILENISYEYIKRDGFYRIEDINELVDLILDTVCSKKPFIRIGGEEIPTEVVKSRFLKLNSGHIKYVLDCMGENTTKVHNIRQYLLTALYNAPVTMNHYFTSLVNHDMYRGIGKEAGNAG